MPVYGSENTLEELTTRLERTLGEHGALFELIYVNDGSRDGSWDVMKRLQAEHERLTVIDLTRNFGQHHALLCGFAHARGEIVVTLDDDLQHPPEEIPALLGALEDESVDAAVGRYEGKRHGPIRNLGTWILKKISARALDLPRDLHLTSFRAMRRPIVEALLQFKVASPRIGLMLVEVTRRVVNVDVRHEERKVGRSGFTLKRLVKTALDDILNYSSWPLQVVSGLGFTVAALSVLLGIYYVVKYLAGGITVSGFTTLVLLVSFFGGTILMTLGIVGEYLIRIIRASEIKPPYVVRETRSSEPEALDAG